MRNFVCRFTHPAKHFWQNEKGEPTFEPLLIAIFVAVLVGFAVTGLSPYVFPRLVKFF